MSIPVKISSVRKNVEFRTLEVLPDIFQNVENVIACYRIGTPTIPLMKFQVCSTRGLWCKVKWVGVEKTDDTFINPASFQDCYFVKENSEE